MNLKNKLLELQTLIFEVEKALPGADLNSGFLLKLDAPWDMSKDTVWWEEYGDFYSSDIKYTTECKESGIVAVEVYSDFEDEILLIFDKENAGLEYDY